uniref:Maturase n=1 Tax=Trachelomonas grandis TaxID=215769 RepID=A0A385UKZ4_9EUGL|nr:hypothetical protein [Trachelomonas grandis]
MEMILVRFVRRFVKGNDLLFPIFKLSYELKGVLNIREIQKIPSVRFYSKVFSLGPSFLSLSVIFALSKSLGPELELLSSMSIIERFNYLSFLKDKLIKEKISGSLASKSKIFFDKFELFRYRKALALQLRSIMVSTSIFLPHSISIGCPIKFVNVDLIFESCRNLWESWGLDVNEFEFLLRKEVSICSSKSNFLINPDNILECLRILIWSEINNVIKVGNEVNFDSDLIILRSISNLTLLEEHFGFFVRSTPFPSNHLVVTDIDLRDELLCLAWGQRKGQSLNN